MIGKDKSELRNKANRATAIIFGFQGQSRAPSEPFYVAIFGYKKPFKKFTHNFNRNRRQVKATQIHRQQKKGFFN